MFSQLSKLWQHVTFTKKTLHHRKRTGLGFESMEQRSMLAGGAGVTVTFLNNLSTSEDGKAAVFSMVLTSKPTANVTIPLVSNLPAAGKPNVASITFTPVNWNVAKNVTVSGVADSIRGEAPQPYKIITGKPTSTDASYRALKATDVADVPVVNLDSIAKVVVSPANTPANPLITDETGRSATIKVKLNVKPTANVVIPLAVSNTAEARLSTSRLTFTPLNWNVFQTVTVTGIEDHVFDADKAYKVKVLPGISADLRFKGFDGADVNFVNKANTTVTRFDGTYNATFSGSATIFQLGSQPVPVSGSITAAVSNGRIQATLNLSNPNVLSGPVVATGTISNTGAVVINAGGSLAGFTFRGTLKVNATTGILTLQGTWSGSNSLAAGQGTWSATRTTA